MNEPVQGAPLIKLVLTLIVGLCGVLQQLLANLQELLENLVLSVLDFDHLTGQTDQRSADIGRTLACSRSVP